MFQYRYDRVLKCIIDGKCPHVIKVPSGFVKEARINAMLIACAVGTRNAIADSLLR